MFLTKLSLNNPNELSRFSESKSMRAEVDTETVSGNHHAICAIHLAYCCNTLVSVCLTGHSNVNTVHCAFSLNDQGEEIAS